MNKILKKIQMLIMFNLLSKPQLLKKKKKMLKKKSKLNLNLYGKNLFNYLVFKQKIK